MNQSLRSRWKPGMADVLALLSGFRAPPEGWGPRVAIEEMLVTLQQLENPKDLPDARRDKTVRTLMIVAVSMAVLLVPALGQEAFPKAEVFGGYQFSHLDPTLSANGWNTAINGSLRAWFGVAADFSGTYKNGTHVYTYMFGPTFSARSERVTPFAHALFGGAGGSSAIAFSMALGGGADVTACKHFAVRLIQADWLLLRSEGVTNKRNVRVSTGIVFRF